MMDAKLNTEDLFELVLCAVGKVTENEIIDTVIDAYVQKLNCFMAAVVKTEHGTLINKNVFPSDYTQQSSWQYIVNYVSENSRQINDEFSELSYKNEFYYLYRLSDYGYLIFGLHTSFDVVSRQKFQSVVKSFDKFLSLSLEVEKRKATEIKLLEERSLLPEIIDNLPESINSNDLASIKTLAYTEKRKMHEHLQLFMNLFDNLPDAVEILLENGQLFYVNKIAREYLGIDSNEIDNYSVTNFTCFFQDEADFNNKIESLKKDESLLFESVCESKKTGLKFPIEVRLNYVSVNDNGYIVINSRDITEKKKSQEKIIENEFRFEQLAFKGRTIVWEIDTDGLYTYISPAVKEVLSYDPEELVGKEYFYNLQEVEKRDSFKQKAFEQMNNRELILDSVNLYFDKKGNPLWLSTNCFPIYFADGSFKGYRGSDTDVTERVLSEQRMREHEQFQQSLIENVTVGIMIIDKESNVIEDVNSFAVEIIQSNHQDIIGENCNKYLSVDNINLCRNQTSDDEAIQVDDVLITNGGLQIPVIKTIKSVIVKGKEKFLLTLVDISDRKQTELMLRDSEERKSSLIQSMNDLVFVLDHDMCFVEIHKPENSYVNLFKKIDFGKQFEDVGLPEDSLRIIAEALCSCMESGKFTTAEFSIEDNDIVRWFEINITILNDSCGLQDGLTCVLRDVTEQRTSAETIRQQLKLQELLIDISAKYINIDLNNFQDDISQSLKDMARFVGAHRAYIFNYNFKDNVATNNFSWHDTEIYPEFGVMQQIALDKYSDYINVHKKGVSYYVSDIEECKSEGLDNALEFIDAKGIKSFISIPMKYNDELLGFVGFDSINSKPKYSSKEKQLLELYAQMIVNVEIRKRGVEMLTYQEEKYRNIISNIKLGLVELDVNDVVVFVNNEFCEMSGINRRNLIGKYAGKLLLPSQQDSLLKYKDKIHSSSNYQSLELKIGNKKGNDKWWMVNGAPRYNDKKEVVGSVGVFLDISNQKLLQSELEFSKQFAENASKTKEQFLTNMSHEIRTPLNVIIGMVRELGNEKLSPNQRTLVAHSEASAYHLLTIVNNILDMSKIEAGEFSLDYTDFSLSAVLTDVESILNSKAKSKKLRFDVNGITDNKLVLNGDVLRLRQVLINLLTNSIKFTDEGYVALNVCILSESKTAKTLRFEIVDTGIGISDEFQKRLFEKFSQEQDKDNRSFEGTGLGMSISKQLVDLMGGVIGVKSKKGVGTTIWFDITFNNGEIKNIPTTNNNRQLINLQGVKILLVEDNEMNRFIAKQSLNRMKCEIVEAVNGLEAIEKVQQSKFDIILMDIQMPKMDGVTATKYIRNELKYDIPIMAVTANAFKHDIELYLSIGMNDFLIKPYKEDDLFKKIEKNIGSRFWEIEKAEVENQSLLIVDSVVSENTLSVSNLYSLAQLNAIGQGDASFVNAMVEMFVTLATDTVAAMNEALKQNDVAAIKKLAHKIKPSLGNLEIFKIEEEILLLESYDLEKGKTEQLVELVEFVVSVLNTVITQLTNKDSADSDSSPVLNNKVVDSSAGTSAAVENVGAEIIPDTIVAAEIDSVVSDNNESESNLYSLAQLNEIGQGDASFVNAMVEMFVKLAVDTVAAMNEALKQNDVAAIKKLAHKIIPSLGNLEIFKIEEEILLLESYDLEKGKTEQLVELVEFVVSVLNTVITQLTNKDSANSDSSPVLNNKVVDSSADTSATVENVGAEIIPDTIVAAEIDSVVSDNNESESNLYSLAQLNEIGQGDESFVNAMVEMFVKLAADTVAAMNEALKQNDVAAIKKLAHKIKPSLGNLEIFKIEEEILLLESYDLEKGDKIELENQMSKVVTVLNVVIASLEKR